MTATEAPGSEAFLVCCRSLSWCFGALEVSEAEFVEFETLTPSQLSTTGTSPGACPLPAADAFLRSDQRGPAETPRLAWWPLGFLTHLSRAVRAIANIERLSCRVKVSPSYSRSVSPQDG